MGQSVRARIIAALVLSAGCTCEERAPVARRDAGPPAHAPPTIPDAAPPAPPPLHLARAGPRVAAGGGHSCAVAASGDVFCWGRDGYGQLGVGDVPHARCHVSAPNVDLEPFRCVRSAARVAGLSDAVGIAAGGRNDCALLSTGDVLCWGDNRFGAVGDGTRANVRTSPVRVHGVRRAVEVAVSSVHGCARLDDGQVLCWGRPMLDEVVDVYPGTFPVPGIDDAASLSVDASHSCVAREDGRVSCWGDEDTGALGSPTAPRGHVVSVAGIEDAVEVAAGGEFACARRRTGAVVCWGADFGPSGPVPIPGVAGAVQIAAGSYHACARLASGAVSCWGRDFGAGDRAPLVPRAHLVPGLSHATDISVGSGHACAVRAGGAVCWGDGASGELGAGDGRVAGSSRPLPVEGLPPG